MSTITVSSTHDGGHTWTDTEYATVTAARSAAAAITNLSTSTIRREESEVIFARSANGRSELTAVRISATLT